MTSPFVRRRRLAAELRALREQRGMTADRLACLIHQSRMKISKLENAHIRPDLAEIMKILDILGVTGETERGWWDAYGDAMGDRQRLYADIESGAKTIREYEPGAMPGILQTPNYTWALIEHAKAKGPITYIPERLVEARHQASAPSSAPAARSTRSSWTRRIIEAIAARFSRISTTVRSSPPSACTTRRSPTTDSTG
jgi:transcriptional regulator with XRE-family HTH domain